MPEAGEVCVHDISKTYRVYSRPSDRLRELLWRRSQLHTEVRALQNVSFELAKGERLGILGENGSGKSTLLKIISSVLSPSQGSAAVGGRVTSLLELGTGFNGELTGRQNVFQNGMLVGHSREAMEERYPKIRDFAEIGNFIDQPLKTYSTGMVMRLAFSCAAFVEPDVLIIDEALSVGDQYFQNKCLHQIKDMLDSGVTFIYVSHSHDSVRSLCNRAILLSHGHLALEGTPREVSDYYLKTLYEKQMKSSWFRSNSAPDVEIATSNEANKSQGDIFWADDEFKTRCAPLRTGTGEARIMGVRIRHQGDTPGEMFRVGSRVEILTSIEIVQAMEEQFNLGVGVCDEQGVTILQFGSIAEKVDLSQTKTRERFVVSFQFDIPLRPGRYHITAGLAHVAPSADKPCYQLITNVIDNCVGGEVFTVAYDGMTKEIWGQVQIPVKASCIRS